MVWPRLLVFPQGTKSAPEHARKNRPGVLLASLQSLLFVSGKKEDEKKDKEKDKEKEEKDDAKSQMSRTKKAGSQ